MEYHLESVTKVAEWLETSPTGRLTTDEVSKRLEQHGKNALEARRKGLCSACCSGSLLTSRS